MKNKYLWLCIVSIAMLMLLVSCAPKSYTQTKQPIPSSPPERPQPEYTSPTVETADALSLETDEYPDNVIVRDIPGEIQFDWDEAMANIYIAGKKVGFPKTVADLGEGFSFEGKPLQNEDGTVTDGLMYNGKKVTTLGVVGQKETYDENSVVKNMFLDMYLNICYEGNVIYGFSIGSHVTHSEIVDFFGTPTFINARSVHYANDASHEEYIADWHASRQSIVFSISDEKKLSAIIIEN